MTKSLVIAYFCWLIGGIFGLHHIYLGRFDHAFITFATAGYFLIGLVRDIWRLPEYVRDANEDLKYMEELMEQQTIHKRPPSGIVRQWGLLTMGNLFAYLAENALPKEFLTDISLKLLCVVFVPLAASIGVWLAGNVGRHQGSIKQPLISAYGTAIVLAFFDISPASFSTIAAQYTFNTYSKAWRKNVHPQKPAHTKFLWFALCIALYLSLWSSMLYFNCTIQDPDTQKPIKCRIALENVFNSPAYLNLSHAIWSLVEHVRHQGLINLWNEIIQEFDVSGRSTALATLGLSEDASPEEIHAQYKRLCRENHPDRERDIDKKSAKHEKFISIQDAYRKLKKHDEL